MRILLVNKFIFPKGGAETYTFDVGKMLEEHGHEVQYFGLENEKNIVGNRIGSYVTNMDFSQGIKANLNAPFRIIYSREARKKIRAVLDDFQPDVVHLNNIQYHLTPSIILEINKWRKETKKECKIVYTTHDYQLVCPSHGMFDVNMKPCELCLDGHYIHCFQTKCLKIPEQRVYSERWMDICGNIVRHTRMWMPIFAVVISLNQSWTRRKDSVIKLSVCIISKKKCHDWITFKKGVMC